MMNFYYLRYFVTLAQVRHYTKAAKELCISQPSLSHAIAQLEKELGVALFEKNGRNTTLTRFGEEFLLCAKQTLSTLDAGVEHIRRGACGDGLIRLGFLRMLGVDFVPRITARFLKENADHHISFTFHTGDTQTLLEGLSAGNYDLLFCSQPSSDLHFTAVPVQTQNLVLIVPKAHPLAARRSVRLQETIPYPQIFFTKSSGVRPVVDEMFAKCGYQPLIAYETQEDQVIAGLVAQGFGIAVVPYMDLLQKLEVEVLQISASTSKRSLYLVSNEQIYMPPVVKAFAQFVVEETKERGCNE